MISTLDSMNVCSNDLYSMRKLFKVMLEQHLVDWNAMILAMVGESGEGYGFFQLIHHDMRPNLVRLMSILPSCGHLANACNGESVHVFRITFGFTYNVGVIFALVSMDAKLGELDATRYLFNSISEKNLLLWDSMLSSFLLDGLWHKMLNIIITMIGWAIMEFHALKFPPGTPCSQTPSITMPIAISMINVISMGSISPDLRFAHAYVIINGFDSDVNVMNGLLSINSGCDWLNASLNVFHKMKARNMGQDGVRYDFIILIIIVSGFNQVDEKTKGMPTNALLMKSDYSSDAQLTNELLSMYVEVVFSLTGHSIITIITANENYGKLYFSPLFTATINHVLLFYGSDLWRQSKSTMSFVRLYIHSELVGNYKQVLL